MRTWWPAVASSLVIHAGLVTSLAIRAAAPPTDAPINAPRDPHVVAAPSAAALDVEIIDIPMPAPAAVPPERPAPPARPAPKRASAASSAIAVRAAEPAARATEPDHGGADRPAAPADAPAAPAGRSRWLDMRRGDVPRVVLPAGRWDALDHPPAGTAPVRAPDSGLLDEVGGGRRRSDQGTFVAEVNRDGSVTLKDRANLRPYLAVPSPRSLGNALAGWYGSDKWNGEGGDTAMSRQIQVSGSATTEPKDPTTPRPKDREAAVILPVIGATFDVTDWLMRRHGGDPYSARKLAMLDATRDERVEIGRRDRRERLARVPEIVQRHLQVLWAQAGDLAGRKRALFALWDDCAEAGDPAVVAAGEAARRMVIGFIRTHLPAGSPEAYSAAEIAELARTQQSKAAFQPYD